MSDSPWYYSDSNSQQQGPLSLAQVQQLAATGVITPSTPLWRQGFKNWTPAGEVQGIFTSPGPAPPPLVSATPYASTPHSTYQVAPVGEDFPIPFVKKSSFKLFIGAYLVGLMLLVLGGILFFLSLQAFEAKSTAHKEDLSHIEDAGTPRANEEKKPNQNNAEFEFPFEEEPEKFLGGFALMLLSFAFLMFGNVYSYIILYRAWHVIQAGGAKTTPGKAVGFMFIPYFNLYWMFVGYYNWSEDWTRIRSAYPNLMAAPSVNPNNFLVGCILMIVFIPVGIFFFFSMIRKMCRVSNYMASTYALSQSPSDGLTGTRL